MKANWILHLGVEYMRPSSPSLCLLLFRGLLSPSLSSVPCKSSRRIESCIACRVNEALSVFLPLPWSAPLRPSLVCLPTCSMCTVWWSDPSLLSSLTLYWQSRVSFSFHGWWCSCVKCGCLIYNLFKSINWVERGGNGGIPRESPSHPYQRNQNQQT